LKDSVRRILRRGDGFWGVGWKKADMAEPIEEREDVPVLESPPADPFTTRSFLFLILKRVPPVVIADDAAEMSEYATELGREGDRITPGLRKSILEMGLGDEVNDLEILRSLYAEGA